jgi:hypothetical protein
VNFKLNAVELQRLALCLTQSSSAVVCVRNGYLVYQLLSGVVLCCEGDDLGWI